MEPKNIILCCNSAKAIQNFRLNLIASLIENGNKVKVIAPVDVNVKKIESTGAKVLPWKVEPRGFSIFSELKSFLNLMIILLNNESHCIILYTIKPIIYGNIINIFLRRKALNVITGLGYVFVHKSRLNSLLKVLLKLSLRMDSQTWCLNEDDKKLLLTKGFVKKRELNILPGEGISLQHYKPNKKKPFNNECVFLMISRLVKDKGVEEYAQAAEAIKGSGIKARFVLIGNFNETEMNAVEKSSLDHWVSSGILEYKGQVNDVRPFIESCDCVVLPSYREGLPRSILEAFSMEKLVVVSDVPGCRELVTNGLNGFLCRPGDSKSLVRALKSFMLLEEDKKTSLGKQNRILVAERYSDEVIYNYYSDYLRFI